MPRPVLRLSLVTLDAPGSLLLTPTFPESCTLPAGLPKEGAIFGVKASALTRLLLREKKDVVWEGNFEALDAVDVIEDFRESPTGILSFDSVGFSVCLAGRKPNAVREAMVAAWLATANCEERRRRL